MRKPVRFGRLSSLVLKLITVSVSILAVAALHGQQPPQITIHWDNVTVVSKTTPTLQVVVNPPLRPGELLGKAAYKALKDLGADYVRYVPWYPYPKLVVAELDPPTPQKTSWDFTLIDPMTKDFLAATDGHPTVMNFSTIPAWLWKTDKPVTYPADPDQVDWQYTRLGTELRDPSGKEVGDYYARLVSWYVNGGFTDENGVKHESGYHYKFPVWEVLNEPEVEDKSNVQQSVARYDAIVSAIHKVSPETKFMGMAAGSTHGASAFEYFLDPKNHRPGIPLDYISYHFYAGGAKEQTLDSLQYTFFDQAEGFRNTVRYVEVIRKRLSPETKTDVDELGSGLATDNTPGDNVLPPAASWNLSGALYAYLFIELSRLQIDIVGESQLVGYPSQFPGVSMMNWTTNQPNARFWVLKLIKDSVHPGDKLVETFANTGDLAAQAFVTPAGRKLLLVNKRNREIEIAIPDANKATAMTVDETSGESPARGVKPVNGVLNLEPFAVAVVNW